MTLYWPASGVHRGGHEDFVLRAMNREDAVHLHLRLAFGRHLALHAIGTEGDFGIFGALQNAGVHALVARRAAALAAGGIDDEFAGCLAGLRVEAQRAALQLETPVDGVQQAAEGELHLGLRRVDGQRLGCAQTDSPAVSRRAATQRGTKRRISFIMR